MSKQRKTGKCSFCAREDVTIVVNATQECNLCYAKQYREAHKEEFAKGGKWYSSNYNKPKPPRYTYTCQMPPNPRLACTYNAAHQRVRAYLGKASEYLCNECGSDAEQWAYIGNSEYEQSGKRKRQVRGVWIETEGQWSGYIYDYEPLCGECHLIIDGHMPANREWEKRRAEYQGEIEYAA